MTQKFIVTGGAGFIGSNIVAKLNELGFEDIIIVDDMENHSAENSLSSSTTDSDRADEAAKKKNYLKSLKYKEYMDKKEFRELFNANKQPTATTVFHMGACSSTTETNEEYLTDNNYLYTQELCKWCVKNGIRFIYASSAATYGDGAEGYSDDIKLIPSLKPLNLYGKSKQMFDMWAIENGMLDKIVGLKFFNVYGPREDHKGDMRSLVNKAYKQILDTNRLKLFKSYKPEYGDGEQERDFVYVNDVVKVAFFFNEHRNVSGIFNCGTGKARNWLDLANAVFAAMSKESCIDFIEMPMSIRDKYQYHTQANMNKLRQAGYSEEFTSIEDGVNDYVTSWLRDRIC